MKQNSNTFEYNPNYGNRFCLNNFYKIYAQKEKTWTKMKAVLSLKN